MPSPEFEQAASSVKNLKTLPENEDLLQLYALFKQATVGKNDTPQPGMFDLKGKAKWRAWNECTFTSEEAEQEYIKLANKLKEKHGVNE